MPSVFRRWARRAAKHTTPPALTDARHKRLLDEEVAQRRVALAAALAEPEAPPDVPGPVAPDEVLGSGPAAGPGTPDPLGFDCWFCGAITGLACITASGKDRATPHQGRGVR